MILERLLLSKKPIKQSKVPLWFHAVFNATCRGLRSSYIYMQGCNTYKH